ncbi:MAG TPA: DUF3341 domain-containing protein [Polyangia bacterium]
MRGGLVAEFETGDALLAAIDWLRAAGYQRLDAFTPTPLHHLEEKLGIERSWLNWLIFPIGMGGAGFAFFFQWYCNAYSYPINVGGRPPFAIPAFIPITFETGILFTGISAFVLLFWVCRMPSLTHPLFEVEGFERATIDRFWVGVSATDPKFDLARTSHELAELGAGKIAPVGAITDEETTS